MGAPEPRPPERALISISSGSQISLVTWEVRGPGASSRARAWARFVTVVAALLAVSISVILSPGGSIEGPWIVSSMTGLVAVFVTYAAAHGPTRWLRQRVPLSVVAALACNAVVLLGGGHLARRQRLEELVSHRRVEIEGRLLGERGGRSEQAIGLGEEGDCWVDLDPSRRVGIASCVDPLLYGVLALALDGRGELRFAWTWGVADDAEMQETLQQALKGR